MYRCKPYPMPGPNCIIKIFKLKMVLLCQEFEDLCKAKTISVCVLYHETGCGAGFKGT